MASNKKYYELDDIGFLGVMESRLEAEIKKEAKDTSDFIKRYKSGIAVPKKISDIVAQVSSSAGVGRFKHSKAKDVVKRKKESSPIFAKTK